MRTVMLLAGAVLLLNLHALAWNEVPDNRFRLEAGYMQGFNLGNFNYHTSDHFLLGQVHDGNGFTLRISRPVYRNWVAAIYFNWSHMDFAGDKVKQQLTDCYSSPDNFTTITMGGTGYNITQLGLECGRSFRKGKWNIEPFIRLGVLGISDPGKIIVYAKRRNENYFEQNEISLVSPDDVKYFNITGGTYIDYHLTGKVYLAASVAYTFAHIEQDISIQATNLYSQTSTATETLKQPVSAIQCSLGLQFRFGRTKVFRRPD